MTQFLKNLWLKIFGTTEWLGLNIGFWLSMTAVALLVVVMIVVFWTMKPKKQSDDDDTATPPKNNEEGDNRP